MPPHLASSFSTTDVMLVALGKTWGRLIDGAILEVRRGDLVVRFDLAATARLGQPVLCEARHEHDGACRE